MKTRLQQVLLPFGQEQNEIRLAMTKLSSTNQKETPKKVKYILVQQKEFIMRQQTCLVDYQPCHPMKVQDCLTKPSWMMQELKVRDQVLIKLKYLFHFYFTYSKVSQKIRKKHRNYGMHFTSFLMLQKIMRKFTPHSQSGICSCFNDGEGI